MIDTSKPAGSFEVDIITADLGRIQEFCYAAAAQAEACRAPLNRGWGDFVDAHLKILRRYLDKIEKELEDVHSRWDD